MAQAKAKTVEVSIGKTSKINEINDLVGIRVSPNNYFATFFLANFITGFLVYLEKDSAAILLFIFSWITIPVLAWKDRIVFDGKHIFRTGFIPHLWAKLNRKSSRLKVSQIEQIETQSLRALKRGGNVFYRYRTSVNGRGLRFNFASGGKDYREMIGQLYSLVSDDVMDNRSLELRDYLKDYKETLMKAEFARIPSMEVLESSVNEFQNKFQRFPKRNTDETTSDEIEKSDNLRQIANELRMSGNLLQSLEAFRRALFLTPQNPWLLFEFARGLHSYGSMEKDQNLIRKATAVLRLSEMRAGNDAQLMTRIGESYFQYGDWKRASKIFYKALSVTNESFRAVRGLAEIALRDGKIAHVIHHFSSAAHFAENKALKRWADGENEYFSRLNNDEDYMDAEMTRINWLESVEKKKKTALRFSLLGLVIVLFGIVFHETTANFGWTLSFISIFLWIIFVLSQGVLSERCPFIDIED